MNNLILLYLQIYKAFYPRISNVKERVLAIKGIKVENGKWVQWDQDMGKVKTVTKANIAMKKNMVVMVKAFSKFYCLSLNPNNFCQFEF